MPYDEPVSSIQYFMTQLHVILYYIKLLFMPTNLNLDYDWPITRHPDLTTLLFFILLSSIASIFEPSNRRWDELLSIMMLLGELEA